MPSKDSASWGARAERAAARKWNLERQPGTGFDLLSPRNGTRYQVKATDVAREDPRFRFWLADHTALLRAHQACYIAVLYSSSSGSVARVEKVPLGAVASAAEWGPSGHDGKGEQAKIPPGALI